MSAGGDNLETYGQTVSERTLSSRMAFEGRLLQVEIQEVELATGQRSVREIVKHPGAVVVLARFSDGRLVLVRQFRKPLDRDVLELVAGTLDPGEDPDVCAVRELKEETGFEARALKKLGVLYPAPGYTTETLHAYLADIDGDPGALDPDEDEHICRVIMHEDELVKRIDAGEIGDAKTLATWLLYSRSLVNRE